MPQFSRDELQLLLFIRYGVGGGEQARWLPEDLFQLVAVIY